MTVIRQDRVITIAAERGMRGKDGVSSQLVVIEQTNESGNIIVAAPVGGAPVTNTSLLAMRIEYPHTSGTLILDVTGVTNGDFRAVKLPHSDDNVPIGAVKVGSWAVFALRADAFWELVAPSLDTGSPLVYCAVEEDGDPFWTLTPDGGVVGLGEEQIFFGRAPAVHSGSELKIKIAGINDEEERPVRLADDVTAVLSGEVPEDALFGVWYTPAGTYQLLFPAIAPPAASAIVKMEQTARSVNIVTFEAAENFSLPNATGIGVLMGAKVEGAPGGTGWAFAIEGITLDPLQLKYLDGTDVAPDRIVDGAFIIFTRNGTTGFYELLEIWDTTSAQGGAAATASTMDAFWARSNSSVYALRSFGK